jgi:hypothetical protein
MDDILASSCGSAFCSHASATCVVTTSQPCTRHDDFLTALAYAQPVRQLIVVGDFGDLFCCSGNHRQIPVEITNFVLYVSRTSHVIPFTLHH